MKGINFDRITYRNGKPKGVRMELTRHTQHLPATAEELHQFILVGKEKIKAHQAKIRAIEAVGLAETARKAALADAQDVATAVIYAEAKLGELLKAMPRQYPSVHRGKPRPCQPAFPSAHPTRHRQSRRIPQPLKPKSHRPYQRAKSRLRTRFIN